MSWDCSVAPAGGPVRPQRHVSEPAARPPPAHCTQAALCWVACGRGSAFVGGVSPTGGDCAKPWDWCAATLIAREAGATLAMSDSRRTPPGDSTKPPSRGAAFDLLAQSCVCACSAPLAGLLVEVARSATAAGSA